MNDLGLFIIVVIVAIGLLLLCREVNCWYLKINRRISLMEQMLDKQNEIISFLKEDRNRKVSSDIKEKQNEIKDQDDAVSPQKNQSEESKSQSEETEHSEYYKTPHI